MDKIINKIPNWIRWIGFIPAAFIFWIVSYPIIFGLNTMLGHSVFSYLLGVLAASVFSAAGFIWIGVKIAPNRKIIVAAFLGILFICILFYSTLGFMNYESSVEPWEFFLNISLSFTACIATTLSLIKNESLKRPKSLVVYDK